MTDKTYPITVQLTADQMNDPYGTSTTSALVEAIFEQRPSPLVVGDRVHVLNGTRVYEIKAIEGVWAWLFFENKPSRSWPLCPLSDLTRVDEATA